MTMPNVILTLGEVIFRDFELPLGVGFGGQQRLAVHRLISGRRVIDCLGRDDVDIAFSGVFAGPDATFRACALNAMRSAGDEVPLTWDVFFYSVVVRDFVASYQNPTWIPYSLRCAVIRDEAASPVQVSTSLVQLLSEDVNAAAVSSTGAGIDISGAVAAIAVPDATTYGAEGFQQAQASLATASQTISTGIGSAEQRLADNSLTVGSAEEALANLVSGTSAAQALALLVSASGYVGRAVVNHCQWR